MLLHVLVLLAGGAAVWRAGTTLSRDADALAATSRLGRAFIGVVVLGVATSLPEIATTVTAGVLGNAQLATGNLMGGVALQMVVLVLADALCPGRPLMSLVTRRVIAVQHLALLVLLALAVAGMLLPDPLTVLSIGLWPLVLVVVFVLTLLVVQRVQPAGEPEEDADERPERPPWWRFAAAGAVILVAGWAIARSADELSRSGPLNATFLGAVLVALATSLPEVSTVVGAVRARSYDLAVSNILGTNGLEVALLALADASYREGALLAVATRADVLLAALAALITAIYLVAVLVRPRRTVLGVGYASAAVLVTYLAGVSAVALL